MFQSSKLIIAFFSMRVFICISYIAALVFPFPIPSNPVAVAKINSFPS